MISLLVSLAAAQPPEAPLTAQTALAAYSAEFLQDRVSHSGVAINALHQAACDAGSTANCSRSWALGDQTAAADVLQRACDEGDHAACMVTAWASVQVEPGRIAPELPDGPAALVLFDAACDAGLERGCVEAGVLLTRGVQGEPGLARAQQLFQTACQVGELSGCRRLGAMHHSGQGIGRDLDKARAYYGTACDGGYFAGCNGLALIDHLGVGTKRAPISAESNYVKACDGGHEQACSNLRKFYKNGINPMEMPNEALTVWTSGCDRGVAVACANGGRLADDPRRGPDRNPTLARTLLEKGCSNGDPFTCGLLGTHLLRDDLERAWGLLETSCAQKVAPACKDLADVLWNGELVKKDKKRARALYTTACQDTYEPACERAK